jgi:AcrR family transcriptional regulator
MAPARRRRMPAAQRREVILAAAEATFARSGYHGASLDEVAHAAGVSKALIYEHFESKRVLHASLLEAHAAEIFRRLAAAADGGGSGEERLRTGIDGFLGFVEAHREAWRALFRDAADPEVGSFVAELQRQATAVIARLLAADPDTSAHLAPGTTGRDVRFEIHAQLLSGAVQSLATWWHDHQDVPRATLVDRAMEFVWHGAAPGPGAPVAGATPSASGAAARRPGADGASVGVGAPAYGASAG